MNIRILFVLLTLACCKSTERTIQIPVIGDSNAFEESYSIQYPSKHIDLNIFTSHAYYAKVDYANGEIFYCRIERLQFILMAKI
mgnify:CR=1 FL=1